MHTELILSTNSTEIAKIISWLAAGVAALAGLLFTKKVIGDLLLKLYEYVIQNNQTLL